MSGIFETLFLFLRIRFEMSDLSWKVSRRGWLPITRGFSALRSIGGLVVGEWVWFGGDRLFMSLVDGMYWIEEYFWLLRAISLILVRS